MQQKTVVIAEDGRQDLQITREFDLPLDLLFKAYTDPEIVAHWMGTKVIKLRSKKHGSFEFETSGPNGNKYHFSGTIHDFQPNRKIIRTFEMENMDFGVQLEVILFEKVTAEKSKLNKHVIYESTAKRDANLKLPFVQGINMAHNRLQNIVNQIL